MSTNLYTALGCKSVNAFVAIMEKAYESNREATALVLNERATAEFKLSYCDDGEAACQYLDAMENADIKLSHLAREVAVFDAEWNRVVEGVELCPENRAFPATGDRLKPSPSKGRPLP